MTRVRLPEVALVAITAVLTAIIVERSDGVVPVAAAGVPVEEPGLVPPTAFGGVVGALALALLIVAVVRRADR